MLPSEPIIPSLETINGQLVAKGDNRLDPDGTATSTWKEYQDHVQMFLRNMEDQMDALQDVLLQGESYFQTYLDDNMINTKFFR